MKWHDVSKPEIWDVEMQKSKIVRKNREAECASNHVLRVGFSIAYALSRWVPQGLLPPPLDSACDVDSGAISAYSLTKSPKCFFGESVIFATPTGN